MQGSKWDCKAKGISGLAGLLSSANFDKRSQWWEFRLTKLNDLGCAALPVFTFHILRQHYSKLRKDGKGMSISCPEFTQNST